MWLHSFAERFADPAAGRPAQVPLVPGIGWDAPVLTLPETMAQVHYDAETGTLVIGDGRIGGVRPDVWTYSVSGMQVLPKWIGYRTRKGTGRAASSKSALDQIRPTEWHDDWNDELLDLIRVLTLTVDRYNDLADLLARVCDGPLIPGSSLPQPAPEQREPPPTAR